MCSLLLDLISFKMSVVYQFRETISQNLKNLSVQNYAELL